MEAPPVLFHSPLYRSFIIVLENFYMSTDLTESGYFFVQLFLCNGESIVGVSKVLLNSKCIS